MAGPRPDCHIGRYASDMWRLPHVTIQSEDVPNQAGRNLKRVHAKTGHAKTGPRTVTFLDFDMTAPKPTPGKMKKLFPCPGLNSLPL